MNSFTTRSDKQITTLEILAVALGLSTFTEELRRKKVLIFSDNKGAEAMCRRGSGRSADQNKLVNMIWTHAVANGSHIWMERVASTENISDPPSREDYALMKAIGASWIEPKMAKFYRE